MTHNDSPRCAIAYWPSTPCGEPEAGSLSESEAKPLACEGAGYSEAYAYVDV